MNGIAHRSAGIRPNYGAHPGSSFVYNRKLEIAKARISRYQRSRIMRSSPATIMKTRNLLFALLAIVLAGCVTRSVMNDASKWTIEVTSSDPAPSGPCRIYDDWHRLMLAGSLASGKMDGAWTSTGSDGTRLATWSYRNGVRNGPVEMWYSALAYPEAKGRLKLKCVFVEGAYDGTVTRYYPSGAPQCVRVYDHGVLQVSQAWSPNGSEASPARAAKEAAFEERQDMVYLSAMEDMVARSLAQAHREIKN